jgi:hypothetical protein
VADDQRSPGPPPERPAGGGGRDGGRGRDDRPPAAAGGGPAGGGPAAEPGTLLADLARLRRQTRAARHAYWFPLVLFGLLTCGAAPLYVVAAAPPASGAHAFDSGPILLGSTPFGTSTFYIGWYWAVALVGGYLLTLLWYRRHAGRAGVRTPARGYLITGVVLTVAVLVIPPLTRLVPGLALVWLPFGDVWIRGTLAFLIIAAGLWVLARAERSRALAAAALVYTGAALLASLYNVENIIFRLGWTPRSAFAWQLTVLPNVLLPAAILLGAGCGAFLVQRSRRSTA